MRSTLSDVPPGALVEAVPRRSHRDAAAAYLTAVGSMVGAEFSRLRREPTVILARAAQPLLWLVLFGSVLSRSQRLPTPGVGYQSFIVPGVMAQSVLFIAIFSGLAIIWERDLGISQRVLVAPVARSAVILGKALGAGARASVQIGLVLVAIAALSIPIEWSPVRVVGALVVSVLGATLFASVSMVIASLVRSQDQFMGLGQLIILPLFFASNALYPVSLMPGWLRVVTHLNPLTYLVEALRQILVGVGPDRLPLDLAILAVVTISMIALASFTYPRRTL